jgi:heme exporter protein D
MFGPTEIRIIAMAVSVLMYFIPVSYYNIYGHYLTQYDFATFGISLLMFIILLVSIVKKGRKLHKEDIKLWDMK